VFAVTTPIVVFYSYLTKKLGLHWYGWLTNYFMNKYFHNRAYYEIGSNLDIDNPDQRISEEIQSFILSSVQFLLGIFTQALNLIAFIGVLWSISKALVAVLFL
jgi:putative ATP-binding cassette transporter